MAIFKSTIMSAALILLFVVSEAFSCSYDNVQNMPNVTTIDWFQRITHLTTAETMQVNVLRKKMAGFIAAGDIKKAREAETKAMLILGYERAWLLCGMGTYRWYKVGLKR